jgi:hypothetical protein
MSIKQPFFLFFRSPSDFLKVFRLKDGDENDSKTKPANTLPPSPSSDLPHYPSPVIKIEIENAVGSFHSIGLCSLLLP